MTGSMLTRNNRSMETRLCAAVAAAVWLLAGCASTRHQAPVEERTGTPRVVAPVASAASAPADSGKLEAPKPGAENAGKNGYYTVRQGDTLIRIALENGQNWKDVAKWN